MIYITGDTHGDFRRFSTDIFPEQKEMTKDDFVIICGDFGGIWCQEDNKKAMRNENYWLDWLDQKPFTTLFVCGNHENFDRLSAFPIENRYGGNVHVIRPSILHLMRGETFCIDGNTVFAFGGASSHDISDGILQKENWKEEAKKLDRRGKYMYRIDGLSWWKEELPSDKELQNGLANLDKTGNHVDYIITHSPPASIIDLLGFGSYKQDILTKYLEDIRCTIDYKYWFMGHMHMNKRFTKQDFLLYEQIVRVV